MPATAWVTLVVGIIGFTGVTAGIVQKTYADKRAEYWRRVTWAIDQTFSDNENAQIVGFEVLGHLQQSRLATHADRQLFADWLIPQAMPDDITPARYDNRT